MLLSMQSGINDYDDQWLLGWTVVNPTLDFSPFDFLQEVDKAFNFDPGKGVFYSGVGYVLVGMVLSSITGAKTPLHLNQTALLHQGTGSAGAPPGIVDEIVFMHDGWCSLHPHVTHQYVRNWTTSGFTDLYNMSCYNGWTMGNIAATAPMISEFYAALANDRVVARSSLRQMLKFRKMGGTLPGAMEGTPYGMGLFKLMVRFKLDVTDCGALPLCSCSSAFGAGCIFAPATWGHGGLDWGSGFPMAGWIAGLNASFALGGTNGEGFPRGRNSSLTQEQNNAAYGTVWCAFIEAVTKEALPAYESVSFSHFEIRPGEFQNCTLRV